MRRNLEEKDILKYIVIGLLFSLAILVCCKINMSNIEMYKRFIPQNAAQTDFLSIGRARAIRSDEWLVNSASFFYDNNSKNTEYSFGEMVVRIVNVPKWGYNLLPADMAYSFSTLAMYFVLLISLIFFFRIFAKGKWFFIIAASLIVLFQSSIAWWNAASIFAVFFSCIDLFYYFFELKKFISKFFCCVGLVICLGYYVTNAYPAWMIPLGYFALLLLLGIYIQQGNISYKKLDSIYIIFTLVAIAAVTIIYFKTNAQEIEGIMNTEYPAKRIDYGGKLNFEYIAYYLMGVKLPFNNVTFLNNSEVSTFSSLFPIPWIIFAIHRNELKQKIIVEICLLFSLICYIYCFIGFPKLIAELTFWKMTMPCRVFLLGDLAMLLALLFEVLYFEKNEESSNKSIIAGAIVLFSFFLYLFICKNNIVEYLGNITYVCIAVSIMVLYLLIITSKKKLVLFIVLLTSIISGGLVNPINIGTSIVEETPLAIEIKEIEKKDPGNWITLDDMIIAKYIKAQGVECLNSLNYPPRLDLFEPLDPKGEYRKVYNRYAHVVITFHPQKKKFILYQSDEFAVEINENDIKKWEIKYIISRENLTLDADIVKCTKIYDDIDGYNIYKLMYR